MVFSALLCLLSCKLGLIQKTIFLIYSWTRQLKHKVHEDYFLRTILNQYVIYHKNINFKTLTFLFFLYCLWSLYLFSSSVFLLLQKKYKTAWKQIHGWVPNKVCPSEIVLELCTVFSYLIIWTRKVIFKMFAHMERNMTSVSSVSLNIFAR